MQKKIFIILLQIAILVGCIAYLIAGVDLNELLRTFSNYSPLHMAGVFAITIPIYFCMGIRLSMLSSKEISPLIGVWGSLLAIGVNNILPARLGEVAKAAYFKQKSTLRFPEAMGIIFLERFLDINILALATLGAAVLLGFGLMGLPLLGFVLACWAILLLIIRRMTTEGPGLSFIPWAGLRHFVRRILVSIEQSLRGKAILMPIAISILIWILNFAYFASIPLWLVDLNLSWAQILGIFAAVYIGISIPGMPGGIGMAEGAVVAVLTWYGVPKTQALALALTIRAFNFIPPTLMGLTVFATSGIDSSTLRWQKTESDEK